MDRREFLKIVGITSAATTASMCGCTPKNGAEQTSKELGEVPTNQMTYRSFPGLGNDKVSLLGYGCMRWPTLRNPNGDGNVIDQDAVNELVDYAIAHGVNYFDTSPVYVQFCESSGIGYSQFSQHFSVDVYASYFQTVNQFAVRNFVHSCSCVDSYDPQASVFSLCLFSASECKCHCFHYRLFCYSVLFGSSTSVASSQLQYFFMFFSSVQRAFNSCHFKVLLKIILEKLMF